MTWAIKNSKTGKWLYGTKYGHGQNTQNTSHSRIQTWETKELAEIEYRHRKCGKFTCRGFDLCKINECGEVIGNIYENSELGR